MRGAERLVAAFLSLVALAGLGSLSSGRAQAQGLKRVVVYGDSLSSGFNLPPHVSFPWALRKRLWQRGRSDVQIVNSSQTGDTTQAALDRFDLALSRGADLVIVELGGNDMLDNADPGRVYRNLDAIVTRSKARGARVILAGMVSLPKRDPTYKARFDAVYPTLAARQQVPLYPFFLDGVFGNSRLMQSDGEHPNAYGSDVIAARMAPLVDRELREIDRRSFWGRAPR